MRKILTISCMVFIIALVMLNLTQAEAGKTITLKFGFSESESDNLIEAPYTALCSTFKMIVEQQTQGRIKVDTYPNFQLGTLESMMQQTSVGELEITAGQDAGNLATYDPIFQVLQIPYLFPSTEVAREVLAGPFGEKLNEHLIKVANMRILAWLPSSFRDFSNNVRPIHSPKDMKGLKIRVMNIPIHIKMVEALGASATPIAWAEVYSALQMGVIDGQENAPYTMLMQSIQEVQKYYTLDGHVINAVIALMNEDIFQSLTPSDQSIIKRAAREAQFAFLGLIAAKETLDLKRLAKDMEIYSPTPDELKQFREAAQPVIIEILKKQVGPDLINELLQTIEEVEKELGYR